MERSILRRDNRDLVGVLEFETRYRIKPNEQTLFGMEMSRSAIIK